MERVAAGDEAAFELLYARHARAVHSFVLAHLGRPAEAEDVCQEAFLALWRHAARFDPRRGGVRAWLIGIARNQAVSRLRTEARRARAEGAAAVAAEALGPPEDPVARAGAGRAEAARLRRLLDDVPAEQRDVLLLVHCGGVSQREIAEVTGLPLGTVKSRVRLALARVREAVEATPAAPPGAWRSRRIPEARPRRRAAAGRAAAA
jgi:RNA polymerase sigma-70 factor (ECF subfamily)